MPISFLRAVLSEGKSVIPYYDQLATYLPPIAGVGLTKWAFSGATNTWERNLHGKVIIMTGATSGIGAVVAEQLARQGAQLILLVRSPSSWVVDFVDDLRDRTGNMLIHTEPVDLESLHSVRTFATKWLDNSPPRRLDMVICLAGVANPPTLPRTATEVDGLESHLQINYLSHFHLITLLSPALRVQPPDRDVRVILTTCVASVMGDVDMADLEFKTRGYPAAQPWKVLGASKLMLSMFAYEFQTRLNAYERPDKASNNVRLVLVDPGLTRTPSFRRFVTFGSLFGLLVYLIMWPLYWLFLQSPIGGAQSHLYAAMSPEFEDTLEVRYVGQCKIRNRPPRRELADPEAQKLLYDNTEKFIEVVEKKSAIARKKEEQAKAKEAGKDVPETKAPEKSEADLAREKEAMVKEAIFREAFSSNLPVQDPHLTELLPDAKEQTTTATEPASTATPATKEKPKKRRSKKA